MPIPVICPGCQARFSVSDKFAGKEGPCPKCKAKITIPAITTEEVKIHVPEEFASGGKDSKGRAVLKPIARAETKVQPVALFAGVASALLVLGVCLLGRMFPNSSTSLFYTIAAVIAPALAAGGYTFLRNQELEPYRGRELWVRATICGIVFALTWGAYIPLSISGFLTGEMWPWLVVAPAFIGVAGGAALASLDLDFGSAALLYSFYLLVTLLLRAAIGLQPIWQTATS